MNTGSTSFIRSALSLSLVAAAGTTLLTGVNHLTADRIEQQERRVILEQLGQIIPPDRYDNVLQDDCFSFSDEASFPQGQRVIACRARLQGQPVAVVLRFAAIDGYSGPIGLLMGIEADGRLSGVRVTSHRETPGLGDAIEIEKSDWIRSFDDKSLGAPSRSLWTVRRDGGSFDQFTGATITPRAVVKAVRLALEYHEWNRELLYSAAANMKQSEP